MDCALHAAAQIGKAVEHAARRELDEVVWQPIGAVGLGLDRLEPEHWLSRDLQGQLWPKALQPRAKGEDEVLRVVFRAARFDVIAFVGAIPGQERFVRVQCRAGRTRGLHLPGYTCLGIENSRLRLKDDNVIIVDLEAGKTTRCRAALEQLVLHTVQTRGFERAAHEHSVARANVHSSGYAQKL